MSLSCRSRRPPNALASDAQSGDVVNVQTLNGGQFELGMPSGLVLRRIALTNDP